MTTWTSKGPIAALAMIALSACEEGQGGSFANALSAPGLGGQNAKPLSQTKLAGGEITVAAPRGFCIDSKSVQRNFAVMARCDVFGVPEAAGAAPIGFITVSVQPASPDAPLPPVEQLALAHRLSAVSDPQIIDGRLIFRATGTAPVDGVSDTHWRGAAQVGGQTVGVALYGPENGAAISGEGRSIVAALLSGSQATP